MTDRDDIRVRKAVQGLEFPADRRTALDYVEARGESDDQVLAALGALPEQTFDSADDLVDAVPQRPE